MANWYQIIGEILWRYNTLEYNLRSYLDHAVELVNPQDLVNPDIRRAEAEMWVAKIFSFSGEKGVLGTLPKIWRQLFPGEEEELASLIEEVTTLHELRNLWAHSTYHPAGDTITLLNYKEYHLNKWGSLGFDHKGRTLTTTPASKFTVEEAKAFIENLKEVDARVVEFFTHSRPK